MKKLFLIGGVLLLIYGCAPPKPLYYWGNYSSTLYAVKKNPNAETAQKHKEELSTIFMKAKENDLSVPPGVYAEYGFILVKTGFQEEADKYFDLEKQVYPESAYFIEKIKILLRK
jgi:hypothetical protein